MSQLHQENHAATHSQPSNRERDRHSSPHSSPRSSPHSSTHSSPHSSTHSSPHSIRGAAASVGIKSSLERITGSLERIAGSLELQESNELSVGTEVREALARYEYSHLTRPDFHARRNFSILIHGENRIAHNLYALLLGSGFNRVKIIAASKTLSHHIEPADFNALNITRENLGERRSATHSRIRRSAGIAFHDDSELNSIAHGDRAPDLIVSTSRSQGDDRQRWMSESTPHLYIDCVESDSAWLGPLVLPGSHPCLNCYELHERDLRDKHFAERVGYEKVQSPQSRLSTFRSVSATDSVRKELPVAAAALVAATAAIEISAYAATGDSTLMACRVPISLRAPAARSDSWNPPTPGDRVGSTPSSSIANESIPMVHSSERFDFHPECGCVGDLLSS